MSAVAFREPPRELPEDPANLLYSLEGPTLFHLPGRDRSRTRVVSALMHGNEPSGLHAVHALLRSRERPAVDVLLFVGAVHAARAEPRLSHRMLPGRRDLNRCFRSPFEGLDGTIARQALESFRAVCPEAIIDLHDNSGRNPPYGVGVFVDRGRLGVTSIFASRYVHSTIALGALMEAFPQELPVVTIECGHAFDPAAIDVARRGTARFVSLETLPRASSAALDILVDPIRVEIALGVTFAFADGRCRDVDVTIDREVDRHNFQRLTAGASIGWANETAVLPFVAYRGDGVDVAGDLFTIRDGTLRTLRPMVPVMMTTTVTAARQDCLFYACSSQ